MDIFAINSPKLLGLAVAALLLLGLGNCARASASEPEPSNPGINSPRFPPALESYADSDMKGLWEVLNHRVRQQPLNL